LPDAELIEVLLASALHGLSHYARQRELAQPASRRLAFREVGLPIGLRALASMRDGFGDGPGSTRPQVKALLAQLVPHLALGASIESFWLDPVHRQPGTWIDHRDINEVMLATALLPDGFVILAPVA